MTHRNDVNRYDGLIKRIKKMEQETARGSDDAGSGMTTREYAALGIELRLCPACFCRIEKNQGCSTMTCYRCGKSFDWSSAPLIGTLESSSSRPLSSAEPGIAQDVSNQRVEAGAGDSITSGNLSGSVSSGLAIRLAAGAAVGLAVGSEAVGAVVGAAVGLALVGLAVWTAERGPFDFGPFDFFFDLLDVAYHQAGTPSTNNSPFWHHTPVRFFENESYRTTVRNRSIMFAVAGIAFALILRITHIFVLFSAQLVFALVATTIGPPFEMLSDMYTSVGACAIPSNRIAPIAMPLYTVVWFLLYARKSYTLSEGRSRQGSLQRRPAEREFTTVGAASLFIVAFWIMSLTRWVEDPWMLMAACTPLWVFAWQEWFRNPRGFKYDSRYFKFEDYFLLAATYLIASSFAAMLGVTSFHFVPETICLVERIFCRAEWHLHFNNATE